MIVIKGIPQGSSDKSVLSNGKFSDIIHSLNARVVKQVDAGDSKSPDASRVGSSPTPGTIKYSSSNQDLPENPILLS